MIYMIILCLLCTLQHKTMTLNVYILMFIIIKSARCSLVIDALDQETSPMSSYCPKQKYCREGSHVVCMFYDQNHNFGPGCENPVRIMVTPRMIQSILANVNDIRGKVATGVEQGKDGEVLPRAYGLMKLEWDKELAFFAQVLANQCLGGREDFCRATERFPNPSQTIATIRFKYPNWEYLQSNNTEKGLNEGKLLFAVERFLKSTHALKRTVTKEIIMKCPPFYELPNGNLKYYLKLIRGGATHIGCGVSAFSKYKMDRGTDSNNVQIVCNISDAPRTNQAVYGIVPPTGPGYSKRCGCPRGYKETRSCLCERILKYQWKGLNHQPMEDYEENSNKGQPRAEENDEEIDDAIMKALNSESKLALTHDSTEKNDRHTNGIDTPPSTSKSQNAENRPEGKNIQHFDSSEEFSKIAYGSVPKSIHSSQKNPDPVIKFTNDTKSKSKSNKPKPASNADAFEQLIFNMQLYRDKETTERIGSKQNRNVIQEKEFHFKLPNDRDSKHKRLLSILNSLELEVHNIKFDNDLKQLFDSRIRKIYESVVKKAKETPSPKTPDDQLDNKDLHEQIKTFLENENNVSVEEEISTLRRMIHHLPKGKHKNRKVNYAENDNNPNQNYNHMDQQFDEFHDIHNMDNLYQDILRKSALGEHGDNHIKFHDLLNNKQNNRQNDNNNNLYDRFKTRNQETFADNNARHTIFSKAIDHHLDHPGHRSFFNARVQFSQPFNGKNENDQELDKMVLRRPNLLDTLRISSKQQIQSIYPNEREIITL